MNTPRFSRYKTVEASMNKRLSNRWSMQAGGSHTWAHDFPGAYPNNPNGVVRRGHVALGLQGLGHLRGPVGYPRLAAAASSGGRQLRAADLGRRGDRDGRGRDLQRHDQRRAAELASARQHHRARRARSSAASRSGASMRVRGFFDLFNITNSNAAEARTITTGHAFLRPTAILAPRTARIGARFSW